MVLNKVGAGVVVEAEGPAGSSYDTETLADMGTQRANAASSESGGLIYVFGGDSGASRLATTEEYDPSTDTWTQVANMNHAREAPAGTAGGGVYAIGGINDGDATFRADAEKYDPSGDTWSVIDSMSTTRAYHAAVYVSDVNSTYVFGGEEDFFSPLKSIERLSHGNDTWYSVSASLSTDRTDITAAYNGSDVYIVGNSTLVESFDPSGPSVTTEPDFPSARTSPAAGYDGNNLLVTGGSNTGDAKDDIYALDGSEFKVVGQMVEPRSRHTAVSLNNNVYLLGGDVEYDNTNRGFVADVTRTVKKDVLENAYTASGDVLVAADDSAAIIRNNTTGSEVTGEELIARDGETVSWFTDTQSYLYRTEEI